MAQSIQELRQILVAESPTSGKGLALTEAGVIPPQAFGATVQDQQRVLNVLDFGAAPNREDNAPFLQLAMDDAEAGETVLLTNGSNYKIKSRVTIPDGVRITMHGATVTKGAAMTTEAFLVSGDDVVISGGTIDGNRAAGATGSGIKWTGTGGRLEDANVSANKSFGVWVNGGELDCVRVRADDNVSGAGAADGFFVDASGVLRTFDCDADGNDRAGFFFSDAAAGCHLDGRARRNLYGAWIYRTNAGTCDTFVGDDNDTYNLLLDPGSDSLTVDDWEFGTILGRNQGHTGAEVAGAHVKLAAATRCQFGTILTRGGVGWSVVLAYSAVSGVGSSYNSFASIIADNEGTADTDPAVSLQFASCHNHFGFISSRGHSRALLISEEYSPAENNYNLFGEIHAELNEYGAVQIMGGRYNHIGRIITRDCRTADTTLTKGLFSCQSHPIDGAGVSTGNTVGYIEHRDTRTGTTAAATALVWFESGESGNTVLDGIARDAYTDVVDENGGNKATLRWLESHTVVDTFESGWTNGTDNTTAGQFVEGTKGRKLVSNTGGTSNIFKTLASVNLSSMDSDEWFRLFCYVENASDRASVPLIVRLGTDATNYFTQGIPASAFTTNGARYIYFRKGAFTTVGSPTGWNDIDRMDLFAVSAAANTFALTFDNFERVYPDRFSHHISGLLPHGQPVMTGDGRVATGKWHVNDAGTWKSVAVA